VISFLITVFVLTQNVAPAPAPKVPGFEDKFLDFSQVVLVAGATGKIVIQHAIRPTQGSGTVAIQGGLVVSVVVLERATSKKWKKPVKYSVATANIVTGVILGALARVDTSYTRTALTGVPTPQ
jgi:hypothetical protein